ncbi:MULTISPECIES: AraC family ligand binding domain-containing protein [Brenneria]|nr:MULTISPECIES: AraC family ligand binding domain-containing protein [Brenneria]EHD21211.1 AraC protein arabinose-binding/dimerization [Brenneria sp. EniD312]
MERIEAFFHGNAYEMHRHDTYAIGITLSGVLQGTLRIDLREGPVYVSAGEMYVVPRGVEHKPYAEQEVSMILVEPKGILNTGNADSERTAENDLWV